MIGGTQHPARGNVALWLRLLSVTTVVEKRLQRLLADGYGSTLPRFDVLAALDRSADGLTLGELSRALLVSNGNVTGLIRTLEREGHVVLTPSPDDGRVTIARLTVRGARHFAALVQAHHAEIDIMLGGLSAAEADTLYALLGRLKASVAEGGR